jgi:hypothetical protein
MGRAKTRSRPDCYCEEHHIEPTSVGGQNDKNNLVWLTAREHFVAHQLWVRFETNSERLRKAQNAFWAMAVLRNKTSTNQRKKPTSRQFASARIAMVEARTAKARSSETKAKVSSSLKEHYQVHGCKNKGRNFDHLTSEERSAIFGVGNLGRKQSQEEKDKRATSNRKPRSAQAKENIRIGALKREEAKRQNLGQTK